MAKKKSIRKDAVLANYQFLIVDQSAKHSWFLKDKKEVDRMIETGEIADGDFIVEINAENLRIAERQNFIELI